MNGELLILILEDGPADAELVLRELRKGGLQFAAMCVATEADFLAQLRDNPPDLILADYLLPAYDGLSALASARRERPETPFIFVSGSLGEETAIEALHYGATDYVLKDRLNRLGPAVQRALREIEERAQRRQAEESLRASERSYREIFNVANDAILLFDATTGAILDANKTTLHIFGYSRDELLNLPGDEFLVGLVFSHPEALCRIQRAATEGPGVFECQSKRKDGELFWTEVALRGANIGGQQRVLAVVQDISERRRTELRLAAFSQLGQRLSAAKTAKEAGEIMVEAADQLLGWDACSFALYSSTENLADSVLSLDTVDGRRIEVGPAYVHSPPSPLAKRVIEEGGQLILKEDPDQMAPGGVAFGNKSRPSASILSVSARAGAEVVAILSIHSYTPKAYDQRSLETLQMLADHCAGALQRIRAQEALNASEANYRLLVQGSPDAIFVHQDEKCVYANPASLKLLGAERLEQVLGRHVFDIVPPQNRELVRQRIRQAAEGGTAAALEQEMLRLDGTALDVEVTSLPFAYGGKPAVQTVMRDVTERKRTQAMLRESEDRYRSLVEESPDMIGIGAEGLLVFINSTGAKLLGAKDKSELLGKRGEHFIHPEDYPATIDRLRRRQLGETGLYPAEVRYMRLDGTILPVEVSVKPIIFHGKPAAQFIARDITERKKLEEQLRQSQKLEAIGQLAGGVAHDFNNMLAVIGGNAELLLLDAGQYTPVTNQCLKQIMAASERAADLTRQLLAFSRKQVMQSELLLLNKVVADLSKMLKPIIGEHIDLECRYAPQLPFVRADAGMIEQVIFNLAVNARDAMPRGGHLLIATGTASLDAAHPHDQPSAGAGEFVCLTVTDTGSGIAPEHLPRIFEPFYTTKEIGKGTGLGLATVYGIVQQHQGRIEVSSPPGEGATFKIFLPAIPAPAAAVAAPKAETRASGGAETIMLVEDDYAVRATTRRVLESQGYRIYEATTAREALEVWRGHAEEIALLLSDVVMPQGLTGRELCERLRAQRPTLKVILMSGHSADVIGQDTEFFRRTKSYFVQKPFSSQALLQIVRRCLDEE